jgi:4-hydroxybenzoate polyprenyltransferase/phosphoserine phosphatase
MMSASSDPFAFTGSATASKRGPIVVDLDGTLIHTDLLAETTSRFMIEQPRRLFALVGWLAAGKSHLKGHLAAATEIDVTGLPYNERLLAWLRDQKAQGRSIVLATGSHRLLADRVADHLGLFDEVHATEGETNLKSEAKRDALVGRYGEHGFEYVGDDWADMSIWRAASRAHVVSNSSRLIDSNRENGNLGLTMASGTSSSWGSLAVAMRPHQWMKNLLVFIPLLAAHRYDSLAAVSQCLAAFLAFGLAASSVYLLNDLVDLGDDRHHERKRHRPFAAGQVALLHGWLAWPTLLLAAFVIAGYALPWEFTACLMLYFTLTTAYSLRLKQTAVVDTVTLAILYTLRIIAGAAAIAVPLSFWLLAFSMFLFLSLAFVKRYSELASTAAEGGSRELLRGRGWYPQDLQLVSTMGGAAGYIAVLVLALYIQDSRTAALYAQPQLIWFACPLLLYWISRAWLIAHRGQMHDDPVVFALKDRVSWVIAALFVGVFVLARVAG